VHFASLTDELLSISWAIAIAAIALVAVLIWFYLMARKRMLAKDQARPWSDDSTSEVEIDGREP
jgi:hypothetical protein